MGPIACSYYVTTACNARCSFCDIWKGPVSEKPKLLPLDESIKILKGLRALGVRYVDITGGEPLLERDVPALLRAAKDLGINTGLVSNGFIYPSRADEVGCLPGSMAFSLDSADRDRHNASRGLNCFDRVLESIEIARSKGIIVVVNVSIGNENIHELPDLIELAKELRIVFHVMPMFSYFGNDSLKQDYVETLRNLFKKPYMSVNLGALKLVADGGNNPAKPVCRGVNANIAISPDGHYMLPCFHAVQHQIRFDYDNPRAQFNSPEMMKHRNAAGRMECCKGCTVWCYLTPSFMCSLTPYTIPQLYSYARAGARTYGVFFRDKLRYRKQQAKSR